MRTTRREFTGGALSLALAAQPTLAKAVAPGSRMADAVGAIRDYAEANRRFFSLPALTVSATMPDGFSATINSGFADVDARRPVAAATLFQIGSITKSMTAAVIHQLAAEGRLRIDSDARALLPDAPWPDSVITIQHLLDHNSGLPADGPTHLSAGRLWLGYTPGQHWSYSNLGYVLLGRIAERGGGAPLARLIEARVLLPLGMSNSRGAVTASDRLDYAQAYEPFDLSRPYVRGSALRPAPWMEISDGAGCVASTADDMTRYLRSLASAAQGRGGIGLSAERGSVLTSHSVPTGEADTRFGNVAEMRYGNGLMHVSDGGITYLHHTGGGPFGSAAFHLDPATGIGAFACATISGSADYRPRKLTLFAVKAFAAVGAGQPLPPPPTLESAPANPASFAGTYGLGSRRFNVRTLPTFVLAAHGREAPLQYWDDDLFHTSHPDFADFAIQFERSGSRIVAAHWGSETFRREDAGGSATKSDPMLALLGGRFVNDSPYGGVVRIVERGGRLWLGTEMPMARLSETSWRIGKDDWSPERAEFGDFVERRPQTVKISGALFERREL